MFKALDSMGIVTRGGNVDLLSVNTQRLEKQLGSRYRVPSGP